MATPIVRAPSPILPAIPAYQEIDKKIETLTLHQDSESANIQGYLAYKQCKRDLKESAKRGEIPEALRLRISYLLSKRGFSTTRNEPGFRGFPVQSTPILFFSPRLWEVLFHQDSHPKETALLQALSTAAFKTLINLEGEKSEQVSLETLVELREFAMQLEIPKLERIYTSELEARIPEQNPKKVILGIRVLYQLASIWPPGEEERFAQFLATLPPAFLDSLPEPTSSETLAEECHQFKRIVAQEFLAKEGRLSPEALYRLFFFVHEEKKSSPLRLELLERLLMHFRTGELAPKYCKELLAKSQDAIDVRQRLKKDSLDVVLEGAGRVSVSPWHLISESSYFQALMRPGMQPAKEIHFNGYTAEGFLPLYDLMRGKLVTKSAVPPQQLLGMLEGADFLGVKDFEETRAEIPKLIIAACADSPENIAQLSEALNTIDCPELEENVLAWLKKSPFFSFQYKEGKEEVAIAIKELPSFATLKNSLRVLMSVKERHPHMAITFQSCASEEAANHALLLLCEVYCCNQLGFAEEKDVLEAKVLELYWIEDVKKWLLLKEWIPSDVYFLIGELSSKASTHLLKVIKRMIVFSTLWDAVQRFAPVIASTSLKEETALFGAIASDKTGLKVHALTPDQLSRFLYFLWQLETESPLEDPAPLLSNLSLLLSRCIREKKLDDGTFERTLRDCQEAFPENAHLVDTLKLDLAYPGADAPFLSLRLGFLLKMERCSQILASGTMGEDFKGIPHESARWVVELLENFRSKSKAPLFGLLEAKNLNASHFQAMELLQKGALWMETA